MGKFPVAKSVLQDIPDKIVVLIKGGKIIMVTTMDPYKSDQVRIYFL